MHGVHQSIVRESPAEHLLDPAVWESVCAAAGRRHTMSDMASRVIEQHHDRYLLSTDPARVDVAAVHRFLSESSYWARGRPFDAQARAIANSPLVVGAYDAYAQVGFARMVTDLATFAWLCDVYVLDDHRGRGLGTALVRLIVEHPDVRDVRLQLLATADAHGLYAKHGYAPLAEPQRWMVRRVSDAAPAAG